MSTSATDPSNPTAADTAPVDKGKGKAPTVSKDVEMDEDDDEDEEDEESGSDDDDEEEDDLEEIDPSAILNGSRRTRGVKVDYTSEAALAKAGLKNDDKEDEDDEEVQMKE